MFELEIHEWNCMPTVQKTWVGFKQFFWTAHRELQETTDLTVQYFGMHHANMVRNVVAGLQEGLHQDQSPIATTATLSEPQEHVANVVQSIQ